MSIETAQFPASCDIPAADEALYRHGAEAAGIGVFVRDYITGRAIWSPHCWRLHGLVPGAEPPGEAELVARYVHPDDRATRAHEMAELRADPARASASVDFRLIGGDGVIRHVMTTITIERDPEGRALQGRGVLIDITARRTAELALAASEERLRLAVRAASIGVFQRDMRTGAAIWSPRMWEIFGLPPREAAIGEAELETFVHPDDRASRRARMAERLATPGLREVKMLFRIVRPDGAVRHVEFYVDIERDPEDRPLRVHGVVLDVTDRQHAAAALLATEARFRAAVDAAQMGIYERDHRTGVGLWSARMWEIYDIAPRETPPPEAEQLARLHPDDRPRRADYVRDLLASPLLTPRSLDFRIVRRNGATRHIELRAVLDRDAAGRPVITRGVVLDVTAQRHAAEALQASEARFRLAAEAGGMGVYERDLRTGAGVWSPRCWEIAGLAPRDGAPSATEIVAMTHPDDRPDRARLRAAVDDDPSQDNSIQRYRILRPDGGIRHVESHAMVERDRSGRPRFIRGVWLDVTERATAEAKLLAEKERFRHAAEAAGMGVFERDPRTGEGIWSDRQWAIYGLAPRAAAPGSDELLALVHPDDRAIMRAARERFATNPPERTMRSEYRIVRADGAVRHIVSNRLMIADGEGRPLRHYGVDIDVTDEREVRAQALISANLATLGQMATGIAHELGQPLQAIGAAAATVSAWVASGAPAAARKMALRELDRIESQAERAGGTMRHLLLLGRGGSSEGSTTLAEVVDGALDLIGTVIRVGGVTLDVDLPAALPAIRGGLIELEKVVINLLLNARDAMEGRSACRITLRGRDTGAAVILEVEDTGPGIAEAYLGRIFEPFFTTKEVDKGTGLGLSICRTTMQACGGDISVANTGHGARFTLRFVRAD